MDDITSDGYDVIDTINKEVLEYTNKFISGEIKEVDLDKISQLRTFAINSDNYLDQMKKARQRTTEIESKFLKAQDEIKSLKSQLEEYKTKEAMHAGMVSAYQTALVAIGQGFSGGAKK